jgi:drug/metabolite transporter (DMT)-like permease
MTPMLSTRKATALFVIVVLAWGTNWSVTKQLVEVIPPLWTAAIRSWIALIGLLVILQISGNLIVPKPGDIPVVLSVALLHMTLFSMLVAAGLRFLPASKGIVLGYTTPLWVALVTPIVWKERLSGSSVAGVVLGVLGLGVILNPASLDWDDHNVMIGAGMVILAAICWAVNIVYIRLHHWIASPLQLLVWQLLVASVVLSAIAAIIEGWPHVRWSQHLALLLLYSGFIGTGLAYWAMSMVNRSLPALTTSLGLTATPVVGIVAAAIILGEPVNITVAVAAALIVGGIALTTLVDRTARA